MAHSCWVTFFYVVKKANPTYRILDQYEWVIFGGSNAPIAVHNHPNGKNLLYCYTIPRFVYDLKDYYLTQTKWWQQPLLQFLIRYVQPRYERAIEQMDVG